MFWPMPRRCSQRMYRGPTSTAITMAISVAARIFTTPVRLRTRSVSELAGGSSRPGDRHPEPPLDLWSLTASRSSSTMISNFRLRDALNRMTSPG